MKPRIKWILLLIVLLLLAGGAYWLWGRHGTPGPVAANQDARPLGATAQTAFLPLVCGGASAGTDGYAHDCTSLPGYPSADYGGAGTGLGITLTSVIYGHITSPQADEAYVSYQGSFEPHADNFGGGILFAADGKGGWVLRKWVPGASMDGCLSLTPQGEAKMLCVNGSTGQGETDTVLGTVRPGAPGSFRKILAASDLRETMDPNANCSLRTSANQDVLLGIGPLARAGTGYTARIDYVPAATATAACAAKTFGNVLVTKGTLRLDWDGSRITVAPGYDFAPADTD